MSQSPHSVLVPPTLPPSRVQPASVPYPTATVLSHTNSYTEPSPCLCLPAPAPCLELSFGIPRQKCGSHVGGTPAGLCARPPSRLRACQARSQSLPWPPLVLTGHPRQPLAAAPEVQREEQSQLRVWVCTRSRSHRCYGHWHTAVMLYER